MNALVNLDELVPQIKAELGAGLEHAIRAGQLLAQAKSAVPHGQWLPWLKENFNLGERSAQRLMRLSARLPNASALSDLTVTDALQSLAGPKDSYSEELRRIDALYARAMLELGIIGRILADPQSTLEDVAWCDQASKRWLADLHACQCVSERRLGQILHELKDRTCLADNDLIRAINDGSLVRACNERIKELEAAP